MAQLDTSALRDDAKNIHSIGPARAAGALLAAAEAIDKLRLELFESRRISAHPVFGARSESEPAGQADPIGAQRRIHIVGGRRVDALGPAEERGCPPGSCAASPRCRNRAEMRANHGTPEQFIMAISRAAGGMTVAEADRAVARYCDAWEAATEPDAALQRAINSELLAMHCNSASATQAEFKRALESATKRVEMDVMPAEVARVIGPNEASCIGCEGEQFEGAICDHCGDHIELARNSDGTFRRVYHSPEQILAMNLADPDSPEAVMRRDLEELGATEDGYTNDLRAAVGLPRTGFKLTRDPTSYDPDNPCADPTLEPEKT